MKNRKFRFDEGGDVMEAINASEDAQDIARSMGAGPRNEDEPKAEKYKGRVVSKKELEDSGLTLREFLNRERGLKARGESKSKAKEKAPEPKKMQPETMRDRAESYVAKRAAQRAEDAAAAASAPKPQPAVRGQTLAPASKSDAGQSRILTGIKKNAGENKFMGSTGMKSGGSVGAASRRADGIATKGKTRCKIC